MADELDTAGAVASYMQGMKPQEMVRASLSLAAGVDADAEAEFRRLSVRSGIPIDSVRDNKAVVQQRLAMPNIDDLAAKFPSTTKFLSSIENARLAHDDVDTLKDIEESFREAQSQGRAVRGQIGEAFVRPIGLRSSQGRVGETFVRRGNMVGEERSAIGGIVEPIQRGFISTRRAFMLADIFPGLQERPAGLSPNDPNAKAVMLGDQQRKVERFPVPRSIERGMRQISDTETIGAAMGAALTNPRAVVETALQSIGASAPVLAASIAGSAAGPWGTALAAGAGSFAVEYANTINDFLGESGVDQRDPLAISRALDNQELMSAARTKAVKRGVPIAIFDALTAGVAGRLLAGAKGTAGSVASRAAGELGIQAAGGAAGEATAQAVTGEYKPGDIVLEALAELPTALVEVPANYNHAMERAEAHAARIEQQVQMVEASKLGQRSPESVVQFVRDLSESGEAPTELYVDSEQLANTLNQSAITMDELRAVAPELAKQLEASVPGADVRIPVAELVAMGSQYSTPLLDHLRESPDAMSRAEAQAYMKAQGENIQREVQETLSRQEANNEFREQVAQVTQHFEQELNAAGKFRPEVNKAYASVLGNFYATQAQRSGKTVEQFMQDYRLGVQTREGAGAQRLEQGAIDTPEFASWFGDSKVVDGEGKPLVVYHGTNREFQEFRRDVPAERSMWNDAQGHYFTRYAEDASNYAEFSGDGANVMPVYLRITNPLRLDGGSAHTYISPTQLAEYKAQGYDGIVVGDGDEIVAFSPEQIKSATGNRGTFDPADSNILNQGPRASLSFGNDITAVPSIIALMEGADLSSFLHESGHLFLEVQFDLASRIQQRIAAGGEVSESERGIVADMDKILAWFGITGTPERSALDEWASMTLEEKREHHESWARGFERFLMEGKAPSQELQPLFARFRSWLVQVYKALAGLNVELTDEVRQVMDRMLATDEAIEEAQMARNMGPLFQSLETSGMTPEEYTAYQALGERQVSEASAELDAKLLKDMRWLSRAKAKALKARQEEVEDLRREVRRVVSAEIMSTPIYQAWQILTGKGELSMPGTGAPITPESSLKLRTKLVKEISEEAWSRLSERRMTSEDRGWDPDLVAEALGFTSGDQMVNQLARVAPPKQVIDETTDQQMLERYGDITSEQALADAVDAAVYSEVRARVVATELKALQKATSVREGERSTVNAMARAAKEYAEAVIAGQRVRDLRPGQYAAAQARSAKLAMQALGKSTDEAAMHKRNELINSYAVKAAHEAIDEVKALQKYFRKFDKRADSIDPGYQDQIEQLLERFSFRPESLKAVDKRKAFAVWYAEQEAAGNAPSVPDELLEESARKSYRDMTMEELRGLRDTIKQIEHQGRLKKKLLLARDQRDFDAIATDMAASIIEHGGKARPVELEGPNPVTDWFAGLAASHRKLASLFRQMDGSADAGLMYEHLGRAMNERSTMEDVMLEKATMALRDLYAPLLKMRGGVTGYRSKVFIPEINASLTRGGRLSVALNWGNEANRQRIMDGDKWSVDQVQAVLKTLTPAELEFVNGVWTYIDSFWPEVAAKEKRLTGVEPEKVEAVPFNVIASDGTAVAMRGGYYPLKYDTDRSDRADQQEAAQAAKEMMQGVFSKATTRRGHTKERLKEVKRAVRKDLNVITQHVTQVAHDLAWHEWLIDTNKILADDRIVSAIRDHYGPKVLKTMRDDVLGIATADVAPQTDVDKALLALRSNVTRATMGASLTTAFLQPFGLTQSIVRIGGRHVLRGLARWGGDAARMESAVGWIHERSEFMRLRAKTFNRELREIRGSVAGKSKTMRVVDAGLFVMMQKMQMVADVPTWLGQYEKSLSEGLTEGDAVAMADRAVLESQGGGATKDMAEVQRKHPMLTQFYSYFSVTLNLAAEQTAATDFKNPAAVAGWLGDMALLMVIPAILPSFILFALRGGDDDDEKDTLKRVAEWQVGYLLGTVVGLRELSGAVGGFDYAGPPVGRIVADTGRVLKQTSQGEVDEPLVMAVISLLGTAFGIPTVQALRSYKGWKAWDEGRDGAGPQSVLLGPPPRD